MNLYNVKANINGETNFEVRVYSEEEAKEKIEDILNDSSIKEAIEEYKEEIKFSNKESEEF